MEITNQKLHFRTVFDDSQKSIAQNHKFFLKTWNKQEPEKCLKVNSIKIAQNHKTFGETKIVPFFRNRVNRKKNGKKLIDRRTSQVDEVPFGRSGDNCWLVSVSPRV